MTKKIRNLISTGDNSAPLQPSVTRVYVQSLHKEKSRSEEYEMDSMTNVQGAIHTSHSSTGDFGFGPSTPNELHASFTKNQATVKEERFQMSQNGTVSNAGLAWKLRAYKMVKYTFFSTTIPSVPMVVTQIVGYIRPDLLNETIDTVITFCNVVHAIVFPLMFVLTIKR
jgi:hypothetical protein